MDEQRIQAYFTLIDHLLSCSVGQEDKILRAHQGLIDLGLLTAMAQVTEKLREQEQEATAGWLENLAIQLLTSIWLTPASEAYSFFFEVLNCIARTQGAEEPTYKFLEANVHRLNRDFLDLLPTISQSFIAKSDHAAFVIMRFGELIHQFRQGQKDINIELAIAAYQEALRAMSCEESPTEWAQLMNNLAGAYYSRIWGKRSQNIENALFASQQSLQVRTRETRPLEWAQSIVNLVAIYQKRSQGDYSRNIEEAISLCQQVLQQIEVREARPDTWVNLLHNLSLCYSKRIKGDKAENLEEAIKTCQQAIKVISCESMPMQWASLMARLGDCYINRIRGDREQNIEEAIKTYRNMLQIETRENSPVSWALSMNSLGHALFNRIRGDRAQNIEEAITVFQQALQITTIREIKPLNWALLMQNLGAAYVARIHGQREQHIEDAITAYKKALSVMTQDDYPIDWAFTMQNLGNAYKKRIRGERSQNIENAIDTYKKALQVTTFDTMPSKWASTMSQLADAYFHRVQGNRGKNIEDAIDTEKQVLHLMTNKALPTERVESMCSLARFYIDRIFGDRAQNLEDAVSLCEQALQVSTCESISEEWAEANMTLGIAYSNRILGDRAQNLEDAISSYKQSLKVRTRESMPRDWARAKMGLGIAYDKRLLGDQAQNLEDAIDAYEQALQVMTFENMPLEWGQVKHNLAISYTRSNRAQNIEEAILCLRQALQVRTHEANPTEWALSVMELASVYLARIQGNGAQNIEDAISLCEQALQLENHEVMPLRWAQTKLVLANAYYKRIQGDRAENLEHAISQYQQALDIFQPHLFPNECRQTAYNLGDCYASSECWQSAVNAYEKALQAMEILYQASLSLSSQEAELKESPNLFRRMAYVQARAGHLEAAVVTIERGRARRLSEVLRRDQANLTALKTAAPKIHQQYQNAIITLHQLEVEERLAPSSQSHNHFIHHQIDFKQRVKAVRQQLSDIILTIRQIPGYANFLSQPNFDDIIAAVKLDQPLVYLLTSPHGSTVLIVHQISNSESVVISPIWLETLTDDSLGKLLIDPNETDVSLQDFLDAKKESWFNAYFRRYIDRDGWLKVIDQVTYRLWNDLMGPVVNHLIDLGITQATLIPTGFLGFFPLHAAWTENPASPTGRHYALDAITFTYAPNALALNTARLAADRITASSILAVNEPRPTRANALPHSEREVEAAIAHFPQNQLINYERATREGILSALTSHNVLHFSCHGYFEVSSPLDSGLLMANDEVLSLRDFFNLKLKSTRLAILSACETGIPSVSLLDEAISLPTGLLQAGVAGIIASLWSVADLSTMMLLVRFYDYWQNNKLSPAQALRHAQQWLRDTSNQEKKLYFKALRSHPTTSQIHHSTADYLYKVVRFSQPDGNNFSHPYHWAAFTHTGV
ncbi:hypothetical protein Lepto7375DRAFT_0013 [Leptolyngbya sp. PCC 7375]|nr:hypothetical protein Lepto7375DRAFT_0013 [Leptolyngbya sp. PCC 7375]